MRPVPAVKKYIRKAADIIRQGGIVAFPTETVYGLGADAFNPLAVAKIFEAKNRPFFDPVIVHVASSGEAERITENFGEIAATLAEKFWPGPLTLVLPRKEIVPDIVTAGLDTVAVRMPGNEVALDLIRESGGPIAAPSANPFGYISPTSAKQVYEQLGDKAEIIIDGGLCRVGIESTIIKIDNEIRVLRFGGVPVEDIEKAVGKIEVSKKEKERPESPGRLPSHYAPGTPLVIVEDAQGAEPKGKRAGYLAFKTLNTAFPFEMVEILSATGDMKEAAANFFGALYRLDSAGLDIIYAEAVPETGLGKAIMERLEKAARKTE